MKTARITFLVELLDGNPYQAPVTVQDRNSTFAVRLEPAYCQIIGEPKVEIDVHHRCSMSAQQVYDATQAMRGGGEFAAALGKAIQHADSRNGERLLDAFHDLIWSFVPK